MKKFFPLFILLLFNNFYYQCSTKVPLDSNESVVIKDIWFSHNIDNDGDGFSSYARLNFDLDTDADDILIFVKLGKRQHSTNPNDLYDIYFQSIVFDIKGDTPDDSVYIDIGGSNSELDAGSYDFLLQVFSSTDVNNAISQASSTTHSTLNNLKFEKSSQDLTDAWISYIDDGIFESAYIIPERPPLGASYSRLTEKFEKPVNATTCLLKKVRVYISSITTTPAQVNLTIYNDINSDPNEVLYTSAVNINNDGWNTFDLEYDLTDYDVFYISIPPSSNYAVAIDNNSSMLNGYWYEYVTSNPPREGWVKQNLNYATEVLLSF